MPTLRPIHPDDLEDVLALNARNVTALSPMDADRATGLRALADRFDVLEVDGEFAGFVITVPPGADYDSENYRWFAERYDEFGYLDRVVLHEGFRRRGLGGFVYAHVERDARAYGRLALEVNLIPRNDASLAFHAARGYAEVGRLGDAEHLASMLIKALPAADEPDRERDIPS